MAVSPNRQPKIPVRVDTSKVVPAADYILSNVSIQPETVTVIGTPSQLDEIDMVNVPAEALEISGLTESVERTIDIVDYLPTWAKPTDENAGMPVVVRIGIVRSGTKSFEFPVSSISLLNVPKGYKVSYQTDGTIEIVVSGSEAALNRFELEQGSVSINLVNIKTAGNYNVPVQVTLDKGVVLYKEVTVPITLEEDDAIEIEERVLRHWLYFRL